MADPALNPRNPDDAATADSPAPDTGAPMDHDPAADQPEDLDLETQVDALLSEVSDTVEEINRRLDPEPTPDAADADEPIAADAPLSDDGAETTAESATPEASALDDELAALAADEPDGAIAEPDDDDQPEPKTESITDPVTDPESEAEPEAVAEATPEPVAEPDPVSAPEPQPIDEPEAPAEPDRATGSAPEPDSPPDAVAESPGESISADTVQAELEAALADLGEPTEPTASDTPAPVPQDAETEAPGTEPASPDAEAPQDVVLDDDPASLAAAASSLLKSGEEPGLSDDSDTPADYTDAMALDDELAALAGGDDLMGEIEDVAGPPLPPPPVATEPIDEDPQTETAETPDTESADTETPDAETTDAEAQPGDPADEGIADTTPAPASDDPAPRRWDWLPPKPEWPEAFGRARPLVIAWRHAAWVVPPFLAFVWTIAAARIRLGAIAAEPHARHAVAVIAAPLSKRDEKTRSIIGYLSVWTLFWSACVWVWVLVGRSPVVPEPATPPTTLAGEAATALASD
jgi:hypothetical protein